MDLATSWSSSFIHPTSLPGNYHTKRAGSLSLVSFQGQGGSATHWRNIHMRNFGVRLGHTYLSQQVLLGKSLYPLSKPPDFESSPNKLSLRRCEGPYHHMATQQSFHHLLELRSHQPRTCAMFRHCSLPSISGQMHLSTRYRRRFAKSAILLIVD